MSGGDAMREVIADLFWDDPRAGAWAYQQADRVMAAITAAPPAARLALARAITPDTHFVAPVEPDEVMQRDGARAARDFLSERGPYPRTKAVWRAMIAAARKESDDGR